MSKRPKPRQRTALRKGLNRPRLRPPTKGSFKPGQNSQNGETYRRGVDLIPRRQVHRAILLKALIEQELRDIKSGKRVNTKRHALLVRGAMMEDAALALRRGAYAAAYGKGTTLQEGLSAGRYAMQLGEHIATYLDDKPTGQARGATFVSSAAEPDHAIPPDQGQRHLGAAPPDDPYVDVGEEDVP